MVQVEMTVKVAVMVVVGMTVMEIVMLTTDGENESEEDDLMRQQRNLPLARLVQCGQ